MHLIHREIHAIYDLRSVIYMYLWQEMKLLFFFMIYFTDLDRVSSPLPEITSSEQIVTEIDDSACDSKFSEVDILTHGNQVLDEFNYVHSKL